jgi:6-phosphogluconolactonase
VMKRITRGLLMIVAGIGALSPMLAVAQVARPGNDRGAVFVMTNAADKNEIIAYSRDGDGNLTGGNRFDTGGRGSGGVIAPLGSQGSLTLSQDHTLLFAVNAGSGTISVFQVHNSNLYLLDTTSSGGSSPVAVAQHGNLVYVVNAGGQGSVEGFRLGHEGHLKQIENSTAFLTQFGGGSGGSSISFSPNGQFLVVIERIAGHIDAIPVHEDGSLGSIVVTPSEPGAFTAQFAPNGEAIVAQAGPVAAVSSYSLASNRTFSVISANVPTLGTASCWSVVTPDGTKVYVSNTGSSNISGFDIQPNGTVTPIGPTVLASNPAGSTNLDIAVSSDGKYLFTIDSAAGAVSSFAIQNGGYLDLVRQVEGLPRSAGFQGIAAY